MPGSSGPPPWPPLAAPVTQTAGLSRPGVEAAWQAGRRPARRPILLRGPASAARVP